MLRKPKPKRKLQKSKNGSKNKILKLEKKALDLTKLKKPWHSFYQREELLVEEDPKE